jgi:NADH-quinone oxidoreductase subunit L
MYGTRTIDPAAWKARAGELYTFLREKWHFDELYDAVFVRPAVALGYGTARFDKRAVPVEQADAADRAVNVSSLDGVLNALGLGTMHFGNRLRGTQSGLIRRYVTVLMAAAVALVAVLVVVYVGS